MICSIGELNAFDFGTHLDFGDTLPGWEKLRWADTVEVIREIPIATVVHRAWVNSDYKPKQALWDEWVEPLVATLGLPKGWSVGIVTVVAQYATEGEGSLRGLTAFTRVGATDLWPKVRHFWEQEIRVDELRLARP